LYFSDWCRFEQNFSKGIKVSNKNTKRVKHHKLLGKCNSFCFKCLHM
jgi:hypothetical protein